jgi:hypothetical protein
LWQAKPQIDKPNTEFVTPITETYSDAYVVVTMTFGVGQVARQVIRTDRDKQSRFAEGFSHVHQLCPRFLPCRGRGVRPPACGDGRSSRPSGAVHDGAGHNGTVNNGTRHIGARHVGAGIAIR